MHKKSTNIAVIGELGRFPFHIDIICSIVKFFQRILTLDENHLLHQSLSESKLLSERGTKTWFKFVHQIFEKLKITVENFSLDKVRLSLISRYKTYWKNQLIESGQIQNGKLRTYCKFKDIFKKEPYLENIKSFNIRKCFTQLRISSHSLAIEKGRYNMIDKDKRYCTLCNTQQVEDEHHFLFKCPSYNNKGLHF